MKMNKLTAKEEEIIVNKGTEAPFSGDYDTLFEAGTYVCRRCENPLYKSSSKFQAGYGWPAFEEEISGAVKRTIERDGRVEITCLNCGGHLGHVFTGEGYTEKNTRHCVNSISLTFIPKNDK